MRMIQDDYDALNTAIKAMIAKYPNSHDNYLAHGKTARRWRWDCFHAACDEGRIVSYRLYAYLNDDHIDTALRQITGTK